MLFVIFLTYSTITFANLNLITWKGIYFNAIPNQKGISKTYCHEHNPGSFIHVVKDALTHPIYTDKGFKLDRATFHIHTTHGIYLIQGDFWVTGKTQHIEWQDHVYYFLSKLTEAGESRGVWSTDKCKGFYIGIAVKNNNVQ